ncbi:hypothetical protein [Membranihabitans maritimus]|uniref:hypothetical protein n=1 Tax=Membranihabitans maritimus TaxID=2904244 RepID=UPI001F48594E|nr:hypothetical protein [Membranihabitans maritimus]
MNIESFNYRRPYEMAAGLYIVCLLIFGLQYAFSSSGSHNENLMEVWLYGSVACLIFAFFGSVTLLFAENFKRHWNQAIVSYIVLISVHILISGLISGVGITETDNYRRILIVVTIAFLVFISIAGLIKRFETWSKRQDNFKK